MIRLEAAFSMGLLLVVLGAGCADDPTGSAPSATVHFDLDADFAAENAFFDFPFPSDLRLTPAGTPDVAAFPDFDIPLVRDMKRGASERRGFPTMPVGYFRFTAPLAPRSSADVVARGAGAPIVLIDVDATPERGTTYPVVAETLEPDGYVPENTLAVGPRPGIVLPGHRRFALVVMRNVGTESGVALAPPETLAALARGEAPSTPRAEALRALYAPMWETLDASGIPRAEVVAATVFTTGDVVADTSALGDRVLEAYQPELTDFALDTVKPIAEQPDLCHVRAHITLPQFQKGTPIFATEGLFEMGPDGAPIKQRDEVVPVSIAIPRRAMPEGGFPLIVYFHGSGGVSRQLVDGGSPGDPPDRWIGPTMAKRGFATAGAALPISPERVPGAGDFDYVNLNNLVVVRDTFRQGILESRLLLSALERVRIPPSAVAGCDGPTLPAGESAFRFAPRPHAQGQSMGGMYTNLVSASDPRISLAVPTGAGGYWSYFLLRTPTAPEAPGLLGLLLRTPAKLSQLHPTLSIAETAIEVIDPIVSAPRLARRPLPGHAPRPIYEPVGIDDSYFVPEIYDAMVLSYGHPRAGDEVWTSMREAQALIDRAEPVSYPVKNDLTSVDGAPYTGAVVQYAPLPETTNGHSIHYRKDGVLHQYGCFHETFRKLGVAVLSPPGALDAPCME